ncbi:polysaccharide deacetylase family protein [Deinococcus peraridilitoris]|uniref:DUF2334 domain-containing protein n=1 Tax=Deinococcus peraridilitoris (strain DSM 19664 / LMG 22246 / CIP 109416 / KR-200) TaxID=937777 RepID=L0A522_DEIPD|nr:polysaccharide deacetylase family protein [Deinococcus peraridilitoris]AFZ68966.1 hypothetical protein Deipe_3536 [Deinococcus peraridilitoris DSM 19664]
MPLTFLLLAAFTAAILSLSFSNLKTLIMDIRAARSHDESQKVLADVQRQISTLGGEVLILVHTGPGIIPAYADQARSYAVKLQNLLGSFPNLHITVKPVSEYTGGQAFQTRRTFYLGNVYGGLLPKAFVDDVLQDAPVTWIGHNLWQLPSDALLPLGISAVQNLPLPTSFDRVEYRNHAFKRPGRLDISEVKLSDKASVRVHAWAHDHQGRRLPYVAQLKRLWYFADIPLEEPGETDRYLVLADLLGDMLGQKRSCVPRALVRMEDIQPNESAAVLRRAIGLLEREHIPFSATVIPEFRAPGRRVSWESRPELLAELRRMQRLGARIFQHGYTHQYEVQANPKGISGYDYEFWDARTDAPLSGLTASAARERLELGKTILQDLGIRPVGWVTPHYAAPAELYEVFAQAYPIAYERRTYRTGSVTFEQFFPYPVRDVLGTYILPENMDQVETPASLQHMLEVARANRALQCPWVSFFFHPYQLSPDYQGEHKVTERQFTAFMRQLSQLGFRFVDPFKSASDTSP